MQQGRSDDSKGEGSILTTLADVVRLPARSGTAPRRSAEGGCGKASELCSKETVGPKREQKSCKRGGGVS